MFFKELENMTFNLSHFSIPKTGHALIPLMIIVVCVEGLRTMIFGYLCKTEIVNPSVNVYHFTVLLCYMQGLAKYGAELSDNDEDVYLGELDNDRHHLSKDSIAYDSELDRSDDDITME